MASLESSSILQSHIEHVHEIKCRDVSAMTVRYEAIEVSFGSPAVVLTTFVNCEVKCRTVSPTAPFTVFDAPLRSHIEHVHEVKCPWWPHA